MNLIHFLVSIFSILYFSDNFKPNLCFYDKTMKLTAYLALIGVIAGKRLIQKEVNESGNTPAEHQQNMINEEHPEAKKEDEK